MVTKSRFIALRVTAPEFSRVVADASLAGLPLSGWLRRRLGL